MRRSYILIIIVGVIVYISFGFATQIFYNYWGDGVMKVLDVPSYVWAGYNFFSFFKADSMRPLAYPMLIGLPFLFKADLSYVLYWGIIVNATAWILSSIFIYKTLRYFTNELFAICCALAFTACVGNIEFAYTLLSESMYTMILAWVVFLLASYLVKRKPNYIGWAFVLLSVSILIKPTFLPLLPIIFITCVWFGYRAIKTVSEASVLKYSMLLLLGMGLICSQYAMMKKDFGSYTFSYNGDRTMYCYLSTFSNSLLNKNNINVERENRIAIQNPLIESGQFAKYDSLCKADLKFQLTQNTHNFLKAWRINIQCNMMMPGNFNLENRKNWPFFESIKRACIFLSGWQNMLFSIFIITSGFIAILLRNIMSKTSVIIVVINWLLSFFSILISGISFWQYNRFSVIYTPMVLISFALILWSIMNRKKIKLDNRI